MSTEPSAAKAYEIQPSSSTTSEEALAAKELELRMLSIIRIQIRSAIPGVVDGESTIPLQVPVSSTWKDVFVTGKVKMDPTIHQLVGHSKEIEINSKVFDYYVQFKRNMATYFATIIFRPPTKCAKIPKKKATPKRVQGIPPTKPDYPNVNVQKMPTSRKMSTSQNHEVSSPAKRTRSQQRRISRTAHKTVEGSTVDDQHSIIDQDKQAERQKGMKAPSVGPPSLNYRSPPPSHGHPPTPPLFMATPSNFLKTTKAMVYRDETTQAGDTPDPQEPDIKAGILHYLKKHISNRDMLTMRRELSELKREKLFQALNRLIPFTAGILQNAFIDEHNSN